MKVGLPKEIKDNEYRVGLTPAGVQALAHAGHDVYVQKTAGEGSGLIDIRALATATGMGDGAGGGARDELLSIGSQGGAFGALGAHLSWTLPFGVLVMFAVMSRFNTLSTMSSRSSLWQRVRSSTSAGSGKPPRSRYS